MTREVFVDKRTSLGGYLYYIEPGFAWVPMYIQGTLVWMRRYWMTYPVDASGAPIEMYRTYYVLRPTPSGER